MLIITGDAKEIPFFIFDYELSTAFRYSFKFLSCRQLHVSALDEIQTPHRTQTRKAKYMMVPYFLVF